VDHHGDEVEDDRTDNTSAFAFHGGLHDGRPDMIAAAHAHAPYGKALSSPRCILDPFTQDTCAQIGTPYAGWFQFQPTHDVIVAEQIDLLE
jgi:ribulose-5-phosphate 4-epimerase/fuculose-1-phosphate aldolase